MAPLKLGYKFIFAFHSNCGSDLHLFGDKAKHWLKIANSSYPLHSTPPLGGPRRNIAIIFGIEKLEWWGYLKVIKTFRLCSTVSREYRRVTDGQTSRDSIVCAMHTRHAVKTTSRSILLHTISLLINLLFQF